METHSNPVQYLEDTLDFELRQLFKSNAVQLSSKFALVIKKKPNKQGDCHFPAFGRKMESSKAIYKEPEVVFKEVQNMFTPPSSLSTYIKDFNFSSIEKQLNFVLNRVAITTAVINNVLHKGNEYGKQLSNKLVSEEDLDSCHMKVDNMLVFNIGCTAGGETSLEDLRAVITHAHLKNILLANGFQTETMDSDSELDSLLSVFDGSFTRTGKLANQDEKYGKTVKDVENMLLGCDNISKINNRSFREEKDLEPSCAESLDGEMAKTELDSEDYHLNCEELLKEFGLHKGTVLNINKAIIHNVTKLEFNARNLQTKPGAPCHLIHTTSCAQLHKCKQSCMVWKMLSSLPLAKYQDFLPLGVITVWKNGKKLEKFGSKELLRLRERQIRSSYLLKYGDNVQGTGWDQSISTMAVATIKLQIMAAAQNNRIMLDVSDTAQDFRQATFVMYNCARLSKLFEHYEQSVQKGLYPPIPAIEKIDFSLLRDEDEWSLLLRYVMLFPKVIRESFGDMLVKPQEIESRIITTNINKISCFLQGLSRDFSSYYRRVHVLGEPRSHLFPTMFARLYLLNAIQQVFKNGLALLDILPLTQM